MMGGDPGSAVASPITLIVGTMRGNRWASMLSVSSTLVDHSCLPRDAWSAKPVTAALDESVACTAKLLNTAATQVSTVPARAWGERAASTLAVSQVSLVAVWLGANTKPCSLRKRMQSPTVRRSCQLRPGATGTPVRVSHTMVEAR